MVGVLNKMIVFFRCESSSPRKSLTNEKSRRYYSESEICPGCDEAGDDKPMLRSPKIRRRKWDSNHHRLKKVNRNQNRVIGNGSAVRDHHSVATANKPTNGGKIQNQNFSNLDENSACCNTKSNKAKAQQQLERSTDDKNAFLLRQLKQSNQAMEAFAILLQYLTTDPDVYSLTAIKNQLSHYKMLWRKSKQELEDKIISYRKLEEEFLIHKCGHERKLERMRNVHSEELAVLNEKHKEDLDECAMEYKMKLAELENHFKNQECNLRAEFQQELKAIELKAECKLKKIADEAMRQVELLKNENLTYREKIEEESKRKVNQLEKQFVEKERTLISQLEDLRKEYQMQLKEVNAELQKKTNRPSKREKLLTSDRKPHAITTEKVKPFTTVFTSSTDDTDGGHHRQSQMITIIPPRHHFKNLEDEVCSLRDVLDLKCSEIQDLRKQNEKLKQEVGDLPYITQKLDSSLARIEDLNAQLQTKTNSEQGLLQENRKLTEQLQQETDKKKRLLFQNEELLWKLKRSAQVAKSLAAVSIKKSHYCNCGKENQNSNSTSPGLNNSECNDKKIRRSKTDNNLKFVDSSPVESTPKVLSVVEKSDSVSWVLEIDESPAEVASRMLRRANSLRSTPCRKNSYRHDSAVNSHLYTLPTRGKSRHRSSIASKEVVTSADDDSSTTSGIATSSSGKLNSLLGENSAACAIGGNMKFRSFSQSDVELSYGKRSFDETLGDGFEDDNLPDISAMFDFLPDSDDMDDNNSIATDQSDHHQQQQQLLLTRVAANYQLSFSSVDSTSNSDSSLEMDHYTKTIRPLSATSSEDDHNRHHEPSLTDACAGGTISPVVIPKESAGEGLISNVPSENEMAIIVDSSEDTDGEISSTPRCVIQDTSSSTTTTGITSRSTLV